MEYEENGSAGDCAPISNIIPEPPDKSNEYEYVRWYVQYRELTKPKLNIFSFLGIVAFAESVGMGIGYGLYLLTECYWDLWSILLFSSVSVLIIGMRWFVIGLVKLYQHYAPEDVRRECMLMPTCSEYCILAVRKYGVIKGCKKTVHRLLHTCVGRVYKIDMP